MLEFLTRKHHCNMISPDRKREFLAADIDLATHLYNEFRAYAAEALPGVKLSVFQMSKIFETGARVYARSLDSVSFSDAVQVYLGTRSGLRPRSLQECSYILHRLLKAIPSLAEFPLCRLRSEHCVQLLNNAFHTVSTSDKARRILHCFFRYAQQQGWCQSNPVERVHVQRRKEQSISILTINQVKSLLNSSLYPLYRDCSAAVGLMLWAGIRPVEVARLHWGDVDMADKVVHISPMHSKTGGGRLVSIQPVLYRWLQKCRKSARDEEKIVPRNWVTQWRHLRQHAGLNPWRADTLRHTFASYHLKHFQDIHALQLEMGHSGVKLLFARYLNMNGLSRTDAAEFWSRSIICKKKESPAEGPLKSSCSPPFFIK